MLTILEIVKEKWLKLKFGISNKHQWLVSIDL